MSELGAPHQVLLFPQFRKGPGRYEKFWAACTEPARGINELVVIKVPWASPSTAEWDIAAAWHANNSRPERQGGNRTIVTDGLGLLAARSFLDRPAYPYDAIVAVNPPLACSEARDMAAYGRGDKAQALFDARVEESRLVQGLGFYDALSDIELLTHSWWNDHLAVLSDGGSKGRRAWAAAIARRAPVVQHTLLRAADPLWDNSAAVADFVAHFAPSLTMEK